MTQQTSNEAFEKWYKEKYPQALKQNTTDSDKYALEIWQAATAESDKHIAELRAHIKVLREALESLHDDIAEYQKLNNIGGYENQCMKQARQALASTPAQSLQVHDNEVIERVVTLLKDWTWGDGIIDMRADDLIEDVRKLKGK